MSGLRPSTDDDYEAKGKLKIGKIYKADIKLARNYKFHRKFFALINCAWEYLNEKQIAFFRYSKDNFRKAVELAAGNCELVYSIKQKEWVEQVRSISFASMDEGEFQTLYAKCLTVILTTFLPNISEEEFDKNLLNFYL